MKNDKKHNIAKFFIIINDLDIGKLKDFLDNNPDFDISVHSKNNFKDTGLHIAAVRGNTEIIRILLFYGADKDSKNVNENSPLHLAASYGHIEIVKILVSNGAKVDSLNFFGDTPLLRSIYNGEITIAKYLIDHGAKVNARNNFGNSIMHEAVRSKCYEMIDFVSFHAKSMINVADKYGNTPYHNACANGNIDFVYYFLENNAKNSLNKNNQSPYDIANCDLKVIIRDYNKLISKSKKFVKYQGQIYTTNDGYYNMWKTFPLIYFSFN